MGSTSQGITAQPRQVLATIPQLEICDIPEGGLCCGSAGVYNLVEPDTARELTNSIPISCSKAFV